MPPSSQIFHGCREVGFSLLATEAETRPRSTSNPDSALMALSPRPVAYRWLVFTVLSAIYLLVYFHRQAPAVLAVDLMRSLKLNGSWLGLTSAAYFYPYALMQIPAGLLVGKIGARAALAVSLALAGMGSMLFAFSTGPATALLGRALVGLGASAVLVGILEIVSRWFPRRHFTGMVGLLLAVGGLGVFVGAGPLAHLDDLLGWRGSFLTIAAISFGLVACLWFMVRDDPVTMGFPSADDTTAEVKASGKVDSRRALITVASDPRFWPPAIWGFFTLSIFTSMGCLWGGPYLTHVYGLSRVETGHVLSMLAVGMVVGSPTLSFLAERVLGSRKWMLVITSAVLVALCLVLVLAPAGLPRAAVYAWFGGMSLVSMAAAPLALTIARENVPGAVSALATGMCNFLFLVGGAVLQPLVGRLLDVHGGNAAYTAGYYVKSFEIYLVLAVLALGASLSIQETAQSGRGARAYTE